MENQTNEILFKNTSKMDMEEINLFQSTVLKKATLISSIVFALLFVGAGVGLSFVEMTIGIILIVCGLIGGFVLLPYLIKENQKKQNNQILGDKKYLNTYEFYSDRILISTQMSKDKSNEYQNVASQTLFYQDIYNVKVFKERLFIFINPSQSFIFNFKGMTKGTAGEVIEFLKSKNVKVKDKSLNA